MTEGGKNWTDLRDRLAAYAQAESALEFALRRAAKSRGLSPKHDPKDVLPANRIEPASPPPNPVTPDGTKAVLAKWLEHDGRYQGWWEAQPLSEKYVITEPPYLNDDERDALRAYKWAQRAYWRAVACLAREPVFEAPAQLDPTLSRTLDRLRGWEPTCVDYGPPDLLDFEHEDVPKMPEQFDSWMQDAELWQEGGANSALLHALHLGALVVNSPLPEHILLALKRCRETYLLHCADATVALCRCVVEAATHDWLVADGAVLGGKCIVKWWKEQAILRNRRPDLKNILDNYVVHVVSAANDILHPESAQSFNQDQALLALRITSRFLEKLLG
jgi:hypothetical protein